MTYPNYLETYVAYMNFLNNVQFTHENFGNSMTIYRKAE